MSEEPRIGVFVCHCGLNIAGVIDIKEVAEYSRTLPNVVYVKENRYTCADPGQNEIRKGIEEYKMNRVVVAACSPRLHEPTFRRCVAEAGLNPYLFEMANIREHSSWAHPSTPKEATKKAKEIVKIAVAKVRLLQELKTIEVPVTNRAMVLGGGVAGLNAALDLANMGFKVYLVERNVSVGGHVAQLGKTFPILDCSKCPFLSRCNQTNLGFSCIYPRMFDVANHPNIELLTYSEVKQVEGVIGSYKVKVVRKPRFVEEANCISCGDCNEKCPVEVPSEFEAGLSTRKAIYMPFPLVMPLMYTIDRENCIHFTEDGCRICEKVCEYDAINYEQKPEEITFEVGIVIVATGFDIYEPYDLKEYGYGSYKNVITGLQLERLMCVAGPTSGKLLRPSDGRESRRIVFIQCVGSRDVNKYEYCSGFCCMLAIKNAVTLKEREKDVKINILYKDMRTNFKGYEELYQTARDLGIEFTRVE
ncbi:CoB--CoM heterodisulfide reductase iron-sulfur subunit A family protein, partial [Candidatus Bathyarchaeota archaeon]|nr:CoB--CoM heterodisulfide reductase iron-sulfur subunit A family protein [Candidatus Bathyarchaeota archaeon]